MMTSLSCLTLEVYYRYLPLYKLDEKGAEAEGGNETNGQSTQAVTLVTEAMASSFHPHWHRSSD